MAACLLLGAVAIMLAEMLLAYDEDQQEEHFVKDHVSPLSGDPSPSKRLKTNVQRVCATRTSRSGQLKLRGRFDRSSFLLDYQRRLAYCALPKVSL
jgi:hypothetical protein